HEVDVVSEVLPGAGHARDDCLPAELPFRADLARDASDFRGKRVQLIDHRVDGVLQLENLALDVDRNLARQVTIGNRSGHVRDVANLTGQIRSHRVHVVGEVLPGAADVGDLRLTSELA